MLVDSSPQVVSNTSVKNRVPFIGHNINIILLAHYTYYTGDCFVTYAPRKDEGREALFFLVIANVMKQSRPEDCFVTYAPRKDEGRELIAKTRGK